MRKEKPRYTPGLFLYKIIQPNPTIRAKKPAAKITATIMLPARSGQWDHNHRQRGRLSSPGHYTRNSAARSVAKPGFSQRG